MMPGKFSPLALSFTLAIVLLLAAASVLTATEPPPAGRPALEEPNIILVLVDTLRTDHVSGYGYARDTTPNLDSQIVDQGAMLNAYTTSPWTCPSNAALATGRFPSVVGATWETMADSIPDEEVTLAEYLHQAGYYTAGFTSRPYCVRGDLGFGQGFDHYDDGVTTGIPSSQPIRAAELNDYIFDWLDNTWGPVISGTQPLFLYTYYFDPHTWYDPPPPYDTLFDPTYTGPLTPALFGHGETARSGELILTPRDLEHLLALYDGEIAYWDEHFGALMARLETLNLLENTLIVLTADHGEMFSEHGEYSHAGSLYEEVLRVPLLMRYTGVISPGLQITTPVQSMDLMPTILDYAGITPTVAIQALTLRPLLSGDQDWLSGRAIHSEVDRIDDPDHPLAWASAPDDLRTAMLDNWKYIAYLGEFQDSELYHLEDSSPYEGDNLILQEPAIAHELFRDMLSWFFPESLFLPLNTR